MKKVYDLIILGGGPAGMTAAIYAGRYNMKTLVIAKSFGGTVNLAGEIENWPGFVGSGIELMNKFKEQAESFGAEFLENEIKSVEKDECNFVLELDGKEFAESLKKKVPQIRDKILMILPTKTFKEIQSVEGKDSLRAAILAELNNIVQEGKITNLYFQEFVVQ